MVAPIRQLPLAQFRTLLTTAELSRRITSVHLHHTWRPTRAQFQGLRSVEAMRRFHMEEHGFSDIAQHLTIGPEGDLWSGRSWNRAPASATGHNGNSREGPFMIEMVGDFDVGRETLDGAQRETMIAVVASLLERFGLGIEALRFHREFASKSCPGTGIDHDHFRQEVAAHLPTLPGSREATPRGPFAPLFLAGRELITADDAGEEDADAELPETAMTPAQVRRLLGETGASGADVRGGGADAELSAGDLHALRPHVINLALGRLSSEGLFKNTVHNVEAIFREHLPAWCAAQQANGQPCRMVLFAHGGLVDEADGLAIAHRDKDWWLGNGIYPLFFVWETGWLEIIRQHLLGARAAQPRGLTNLTDRILEKTSRPIAGELWNGMKLSAANALERDLGGEAGGAYLVAQKLNDLTRLLTEDGNPLELHAVGHSAGSILHAHFLNLLTRGRNGSKVATLHLLAPAIRVDLFKNKLQGLLGQEIGRLALFTMAEDYERDDNVAGVYRKSLLYFVRNACEPIPGTPILGLQESIRADGELVRLFGLHGGNSPVADVIWSKTTASDGRNASRATSHGGFDEDPATMNSVLRRILGLGEDDALPLPRSGSIRRIGSVRLTSPPGPVPLILSSPPPVIPVGPPTVPATAGAGPLIQRIDGARRALCVGIDRYAEAPLSGCVNDSLTWGQALSRLGFGVGYLHNDQATRDGILSALRALVTHSRAGDVIVFQYAGHGTQLEDLDGDEIHDRYDEAFVPFDYASGAFLLDDDLGQIYDQLPAGVNLTLFMDCCHSGTNNRFAPLLRVPGLRPRFLPPTPAHQAAHAAYRRQLPAAPRGVRTEQRVGREIHFSACQDNEYAYEQEGQGDFTRHAALYLAGAVASGSTCQQFLDAVRGRFGASPRQYPQLMVGAERLNHPLLAPFTGSATGPGAVPMPVTTAGMADVDLARLLGELEALMQRLRQRLER